MVNPRSARAKDLQAFGEKAERPAAGKSIPVRNALQGEPAWKRRNRENKDVGIMLRASKSQLELLRMASAEQELSQQKVLERILWPILEERYGVQEESEPPAAAGEEPAS